MSWLGAIRTVVIASLAVVALGCAELGGEIDLFDAPPVGGQAAADQVTIRNASSAVLTVTVNGAPAGIVQPGTTGVISLRGRGGPPFTVEARTPSGQSAVDFPISVEDHRQVVAGQMTSSSGGDIGCGWVELTYGSDAPPPAPDPAAVEPTPGGVC